MTTEATEIPQQVEEAQDHLTRENLDHQLKYLARCRQDADKSNAAVQKTQAQIALLIEASLLGKKLEELNDMLYHDRELLARQDTNVRTLAIEIFNAEGQKDKRPHPDVGIKMRTYVDYDSKVALDYAMLHYPGAVKLDRRAFEKIAKATEHDFVTIGKSPSASITRDLSAYLPEGKQDERVQDQN